MLLIDAHVHIYDCFDLEKVFVAAYQNFQSEAEMLGGEKRFTGILLLAETSRDHWFAHLSNFADGKELPHSKKTGKWSIHNTGDDGCLEVRAGEGEKLYLIAGRQIVTQEGLEVLALITTTRFVDHRPLKEVLKTVKESGAIPVIPWGFGKWFGKRGRILEEQVAQSRGGELFLGENGGRPRFLPQPRHFRLGVERGIRILGGTDPLPFPSQEKVSGGFGVVVEEELGKEGPTAFIRKVLLDDNAVLRPYGRRVGMIRFVRNQYRLLADSRLRSAS